MSKFWGSIRVGICCSVLIFISSFPVCAQESEPAELPEQSSETTLDSPSAVAVPSTELSKPPSEEIPIQESLDLESLQQELLVPSEDLAPVEVISSEEPVLYVVEPVAPSITDLAVLLASTSAHNAQLPFTLDLQKNTFALNEIPTFVLLYGSEDSETVLTVDSLVDTVISTVVNIYEGSIIETVVDVVVDGIQSVIDFVTPEAEADENGEETTTLEDLKSDSVVPATVETVEKSMAEPELIESTNESDRLSATTTSSVNEADDVIEVDESSQPEKISTTTLVSTHSYAVVDGIRKTIVVTDDTESSLTVHFNEPFMVGAHTLELHVVFKGVLYIGYYTFTIEGSVLSTVQLTDSAFAMVVLDVLGFQSLWIVEKTTEQSKSFQKIADETVLHKNPVLTFADGVLFWTTPDNDALLGFDVVGKVLFSQSLNGKQTEENILALPSGTYDVTVASTSIDFERIPDEI